LLLFLAAADIQPPPLQLEISSDNHPQHPLNLLPLSSGITIPQHLPLNPQHPVLYSEIHPHQLKELHYSEEEERPSQQEDFHSEVLPQQLLPPLLLEVFLSVNPPALLLLDQRHQLRNRCLVVLVNPPHPLLPLL
jgi:hypothetical protein